MNALHLVGNPAFGRALDIVSHSTGRLCKYHFVLVLAPWQEQKGDGSFRGCSQVLAVELGGASSQRLTFTLSASLPVSR